MKTFIKNLFSIFGYKIINYKSQKSNLDKFTQEFVFKHLVKMFKNKLNPSKKIIIFDVGANVGQITQKFLNIFEELSFKNFEIHCFEPDINLLNDLKKFSSDKVVINNFAIGSKNEDVKEFFYTTDKRFSVFNSLNKISLSYFNTNKTISSKMFKKTFVKVLTIDDYCEKNKIEYINFIKIDTEGHEPECLEGAKKMILLNKIDCVFTELNIGSLYEGKELDITLIEEKLFKKFQMVGIGLNREWLLEGRQHNIIHSLHVKNFNFSKTFLYLSKKFINQ